MAFLTSRLACTLGRRVASRSFSSSSARAASTSARSQFDDILGEQLEGIRGAGTWKEEHAIVSAQANAVLVAGRREMVLNFCANNYLGLSTKKEIENAVKRIIDIRGIGMSSVRFICGTQDIHLRLEEKVAMFHGREEAILYPSCFDANAGLFEAILTAEDVVISDTLNHASIIDGIRLCKAQKQRFAHMDMEDLESKLAAAKNSSRMRLIVTDGVFSMDGDVAPLAKIVQLAKQYDALVFIDECHATGVIGKTGRGTEEYLDLMGEVDIINSTFGKALGGASGGYTTGSANLVALLRQKSRPYLFSNSLAPAIVVSALTAMDILEKDPYLLEALHANTARFRGRMEDAGFKVTGDNHPICPVMIPDARQCSKFASKLLEEGVYVIPFSFPVVPEGKARIRVQLSALHRQEDVDKCVDAFTKIGKEMKIIPKK